MMNNKTVEKSAIWRLLSFTSSHVFWLLLTVFVSIAGAVLTILTSRYLGVLTDKALLGDYQGFIRGVTAIVIVLLTQIPINYLNTYGAGRYAEYGGRQNNGTRCTLQPAGIRPNICQTVHPPVQTAEP